MKKLLLNVSFSKIYIMIMSLVCLLILGGYFSYAMFTVSKEKSNAISIVTGNLTYELLVDGEESNNLVVPAGSSKTFTITLNNPNNRPARFNFYYIGDLPDGVDAGYTTGNGINVPPEEIGTNLEKVDTSGSSNVYKITVVNNSDSEVTINLGVNVGLDYNDLSLEDNQHLFAKSVFVADTLLENGMGSNGDYYDDGDDTFITGEDPNNYIWYSGKLWRAVSINDEEKTVKLVTQWTISSVPYNDMNSNSSFSGSHMEEWLNDTSVDGFLYNLRDYENFIITNGEWDNTINSSNLGNIEKENTTLVTSAVGLLTTYEYQTSFIGTDYSNGYLNNGLQWWCITPANSSQIWLVQGSGVMVSGNPDGAQGIRPVVNLRTNVKIVDGSGTEDDPYRLEGDNDTNLSGTLLNTRYSGEYIDFGVGENNLYRIVSHENGVGTKITSAEPLKSNGSFVTSVFGSSTSYSSSNTIGTFLNGIFLNSYISSDNLKLIEESTVWYIGNVEDGENYKFSKYTDANMTTLTSSRTNAKIGLLRMGELMLGQFQRARTRDDVASGLTTHYYNLTPINSSYISDLNANGYLGQPGPNLSLGVKPSFNLEYNVVITGGTGTKSDPFTVASLEDYENRVRILDSNGNYSGYLKYSDGSYVNVGDTIKIVSALSTSSTTYVVDTADGNIANNSNIQLFTSNTGAGQRFTFKTSTKKNYYNIVIASNNNMAIDVLNTSSSSGTNIQLYTLNVNGNAQRWSLVSSDEENYYYIKSVLGTCMDVANGTAANRTNIQTFTCNQSAAQKWTIVKVE